MSVKVMAWVWDCDLTAPNELLVLLAYADHADHDGNSIFPSVDLIARKTKYSRRTVQRITRTLEEKRITNTTRWTAGWTWNVGALEYPHKG